MSELSATKLALIQRKILGLECSFPTASCEKAYGESHTGMLPHKCPDNTAGLSSCNCCDVATKVCALNKKRRR